MATLILAWLVAPWAAHAAPQNTRIDAVRQWTGSSWSSPLDDGAVVAGNIQVTASSQSILGIDWIRIDARGEGSGWRCLQLWNLGGATNPSPRSYSWNTIRWPDVSASSNNCPADLGGDGSRTLNGDYELRAVARDVQSQQISSVFTVKINNVAATPSWSAAPIERKDSNGRPFVELRWGATVDPDVVEYRFRRQAPNGTVREYAVSATQPGGQGCLFNSSSRVYTCFDDDFPATGYGGTYRYTLTGLRSSPASDAESCQFGGVKCIRSSSSGQETIAMSEPSPSPSPTVGTSPTGSPTTGTSPTGSPTASTGGGGATSSPTSRPSPPQVMSNRTDNSQFFTGTYDEELPYESRDGFAFLPGDSGGNGSTTDNQQIGSPDLTNPPGFQEPLDRRMVMSFAAGLLMVLISMHVVRLLFDR